MTVKEHQHCHCTFTGTENEIIDYFQNTIIPWLEDAGERATGPISVSLQMTVKNIVETNE